MLRKLTLPLALVLALSVLVVFAFMGQPAIGQVEGVTNFNGLHLSQTSFGTATPQLMVENGGSGVAFEVRNSSATPVFQVGSGGEQVFAPQAETVTADFSLVPETSYIVMTSSSAVTSSTTAAITTTGMATGQFLILRNGNASDVIIIDGTGGTVECKANVSLGASDTLTLINNGTDWNCVSSYDNS